MKKNQISLNEEISRMRFLFKAKSGKKMTIFEINKTYLTEQNNNTTPPAQNATLEKINQGTMWEFRASNGKNYFMSAGQPLNVAWANTPTQQEQLNITIVPINPNDQSNQLNNFFNTIRQAATGPMTLSPLTQNNSPISDAVESAIGNDYRNSVRRPLINVLQQPPFNFPTTTGSGFNPNIFFNNLLNQSQTFTPQNIATLQNAIMAYQAALSRFVRSLSNGYTLTGRATSTTPQADIVPIMGYRSVITPVIRADTTGQGADSGATQVVHDKINLFLSFLLPTGFAMDNGPLMQAFNFMETAFYQYINTDRQTNDPQANSGVVSSAPINLPSIQDILNFNNTNNSIQSVLDKRGQANYFYSNVIINIRGNALSAFPNNIIVPPNR